MSKKINSNLYTFTKIKHSSKDGLYYEELENNCLYANLRYPTKIKPEDLPEYFVKGRFYKNHGFISAKGIVDIVYKPNMWINHMFRDDTLYISYDKPIIECEDEFLGRAYKEYKDYDYIIEGTYAVDFIAAVKEHSDFDTSKIEEAIIEKARYFINKFPEEYESQNGEKIIENIKEKFGII